MGRKRRVPGNDTDKKPCKWGLSASGLLGELTDCFSDCAFDIREHALAEAAALREKTPVWTQARINQGNENACAWVAQTVFRKIEEYLGADKARRIFAELGRLRKSDERWEKQKMLLRLIDARRLTAGEAARELAANPGMREIFGLSGSTSPAAAKHRLSVLRRRWKEERALLPE